MASIRFINLSPKNASTIQAVFDIIKQGKNVGEINSSEIRNILGPIVEKKFWHPTLKERKAWESKWFKTPPEKRLYDKTLKTPWDFESWIDALNNAELTYTRLDIKDDGSGILEFEQLSSPSGGIEATEELIYIFDANVANTDCP